MENPSQTITESKVISAIKAMKANKASGQYGIVIEMIQAAGPEIGIEIVKIISRIVEDTKVPKKWNISTIVSCFKGKSDLLICSTVIYQLSTQHDPE